MNEKCLVHYRHDREYVNEDQNAIGATTSLTLRDPDLVTGDESFVRKFGNDYLITEVTDIEATVEVNMTFKVYALDGTLLGTMVGGGVFAAGATLAVAQPCYMEIEADGGNVVVLAGIDVETDVDTAPSLTFVCAAETIQDGDTLRLYLSDTASTYYDANYMYGGARHVPIATNERRPFFTITAGLAACVVPVDGVEVQDSATYDEQFVAENRVVAVLGQTPTVTKKAGSRITREVSTQYNNLTAIYFNETGLDANPGTWQEPKLTIAGAIAARVAHQIVYGGTGATGTATFPVAVVIAAAYELEADYGYMPSISSSGIGVNITHAGGGVRGFNIFATTGSTVGVDVNVLNWAGKVIGNTIYNFGGDGVYSATVSLAGATIDENIIYNCANGIYFTGANTDSVYNIRKNIIYSNSANAIYVDNSAGDDASIIQNNLMYLNGFAAIRFTNTGPPVSKTTTIQFNTCTQNLYGFYLTNNAAALNIVVENNICWNNTTSDLIESSGVGTETFTGGVYLTNTNWTIANSTTDDPKFCKITAPYKFGISSDSSAYRLWNTLDAGLNLQIIEINAADVVINGLIIDGQDFCTSGIYIADGVDHTGLIIRYNNILDCIGIQTDPYDDDADTGCIITNNKIYNGGDGIRLARGSNTIQENLVYGNAVFNIWSDYTGQEFTHNVLYGAQYGLYLESNSAGITFRDNISHGNSRYGIYSEISLIVTYCDITDATYNVDASETTPASKFNFTDDPNFVNTNEDEEDFHIKTIAGGYIVNSPCLGAASGGLLDVGAYEVDRSVSQDSMRKYEFFDNPMNLDDLLEGKGVVKHNDALGVSELWMRSNKIGLPLRWGDNQASNAEQRKKIRYFTQLVRSRENDLTLEQCKIRFHYKPSAKMAIGLAATVDASAKSITDSSKSWVENEHKGYHAGIKFDKGGDDGAEIFYGGVERNLSEWDSIADVGAGSILRATPGLDGTVGKLQVTFAANAGDTYYAQQAIALTEDSFVVSFMINIDSLVMANNDKFQLLAIYVGGTTVMSANLEYTVASGFTLNFAAWHDGGGAVSTAAYSIGTGGDILISAILKRATTAVAADGEVSFYIDGDLQETLGGCDNFDIFPTTNRLRIGAIASVDVGTTGSFDIDEVYLVEGDKMLINKTHKIGIIPAAAFTADEWIGYYIYHDGYYYYILDNTAGVLTLSDPVNDCRAATLIDEVISWTIEKYFKINSNCAGIFWVDDPDGELISGSMDYYIDFIECRVTRARHQPKQAGYNPDHWDVGKTGYQWDLEEI